MTTGRINQVVYFCFFSSRSFFSSQFFLCFLIVFLFQNDLLVSFREEIFVVVAECSAVRFIFSFVFRFSFFETSI